MMKCKFHGPPDHSRRGLRPLPSRNRFATRVFAAGPLTPLIRHRLNFRGKRSIVVLVDFVFLSCFLPLCVRMHRLSQLMSRISPRSITIAVIRLRMRISSGRASEHERDPFPSAAPKMNVNMSPAADPLISGPREREWCGNFTRVGDPDARKSARDACGPPCNMPGATPSTDSCRS